MPKIDELVALIPLAKFREMVRYDRNAFSGAMPDTVIADNSELGEALILYTPSDNEYQFMMNDGACYSIRMEILADPF